MLFFPHSKYIIILKVKNYKRNKIITSNIFFWFEKSPWPPENNPRLMELPNIGVFPIFWSKGGLSVWDFPKYWLLFEFPAPNKDGCKGFNWGWICGPEAEKIPGFERIGNRESAKIPFPL